MRERDEVKRTFRSLARDVKDFGFYAKCGGKSLEILMRTGSLENKNTDSRFRIKPVVY